jgi:hypothetical protein
MTKIYLNFFRNITTSALVQDFNNIRRCSLMILKWALPVFLSLFYATPVGAITLAEVSKGKELIISQSINSYNGSCPCPYSLMRNGGRCGKRSAYSRPGGFSPLCYPQDVSDFDAKKYLEKNK